MTQIGKTIVIALGGNALQKNGEATAEAQQKVADETARRLVPLIQEGNRLVIVHGNGPQVGNIVLHEEAIDTPEAPTLPLDTCVAMSQGAIGYWLQQAMTDELAKLSLSVPVATIVTQVLVDPNDTAFKDPTKPIGQYYPSEEAARQADDDKGYVIKEDAGRGWRRVVASPKPKQIIEKEAINKLLDAGAVVITAGGGGIPVIMTETEGLKGVEAVIDKDFSAAMVAEIVGADELILLTAVEGVMINFGQPEQQMLGRVGAQELSTYAEKGHFAAGSMMPKVEAAIKFVNSSGKQAKIGLLDKALDVVRGSDGTVVVL